MARRAPKEYKVTVTHNNCPPEDRERVREEIVDMLYRCKLIAMQKQKEQAENT